MQDMKIHNVKLQDLKMTDQRAQQNRWISTFHSKGGTIPFYILRISYPFFVTLRIMVTVRVSISIT